jgi:hypothetical protein
MNKKEDEMAAPAQPQKGNPPSDKKANAEKSQRNPNSTENKEKMDRSDYITGGIYVLTSLALLFALARYYWITHGGSYDKFEFWETGNKKWFEVLFWSLLTSIAQNTAWGAFKMSKNIFQKREILLQFARIVETPFKSLALIFILFNIGVAFGETTVSLSNVPAPILIACTIVASYFAWNTKDALDNVSQSFIDRISKSFKPN